MARVVSPRDSPQLDGVALLVTAPLCSVPFSSVSQGCPGLPGPSAAPGGDRGLRDMGYGDLHSGDVDLRDLGFSDLRSGDLGQSDMDSGDLSFRVPWDPCSGDMGSGDLSLRVLVPWDPRSGDRGSGGSRDFSQGLPASGSSFRLMFTAVPVLPTPLTGAVSASNRLTNRGSAQPVPPRCCRRGRIQPGERPQAEAQPWGSHAVSCLGLPADHELHR